jgi:hypothetical protein
MASPTSSPSSSVSRRPSSLLGLLVALLASRAGAAPGPQVVVSLESGTLRVETGAGRRVFPVGVGRLLPDGKEPALGLFYTGPDPRDSRYYLAARHLPAFHRGLPFLRLDRRSGANPELAGESLFGIHGPVTPTLIWGRVSAGCIRMQPHHLRWLYRFAVQHPVLQVRVLPGPDLLDGQAVSPPPERAAPADCPEASAGLRRLRRAALGGYLHDRICGGVDHWYAVELKGGERLRARIQHRGALRVELFGLRGISQVAAGRFGFEHTIPPSYRDRGDRYLRITDTSDGSAAQPYTLELATGR